ncbi:hypothetical protein PHYSODRAFT_521299 [Phytophthora sojae]|uniref:Uncharacterized protein n=1 Tax=Phytophthora sojae (strain P6497) TaxID=1094619 RepID=G4ZZD7_PHYSP|nr:hypothetical protein PHYSODRAFT_520604 [Phytophthora sojae]XP_009533968.1 hypothetical protein PHYSODRAFT_521299 [Phytophthora sojae]EGZ11159.1 hypothetical protein PHYSODRAFT_520604 [Phytophthora sojae]EGZ11223.1 hypothetical protein PHYSODRAFT_521299 [Phytophthora sojae]|eukprot:XP_009533904.1 hypothetical protein PHYSODRAFT_520604 [Phytophthora sojae]
MHSTLPVSTSMLKTLIVGDLLVRTVLLEGLFHQSLDSARILLGSLLLVISNAVEDTLVIRLGEVDDVLVIADHLRNDSLTIAQRMVALVDIDFEATNSMERISEITFLRISALLLIATGVLNTDVLLIFGWK